jgi:hypothetical protein
MIWKVKNESPYRIPWRHWFAWYPVRIKREDGATVKVWFQWVERKGEYVWSPGVDGGMMFYEYRLLDG